MITRNDCRQGGDFDYIVADRQFLPTVGVATNALALLLATGSIYFFDGTAWISITDNYQI